MKLSNAFYTLALAATVTSVISEDTEPTFVVGDTCIFPVSLYLSNTCAEFWSTGVTSIIADGECHFIPGSKFTDKVDPGE